MDEMDKPDVNPRNINVLKPMFGNSKVVVVHLECLPTEGSFGFHTLNVPLPPNAPFRFGYCLLY